MISHRTLVQTRLACAIIVLTLASTPAFAVNKDMVQLQTQVQDLQEAVAHLQQSNDERMGVLKDLVQQSSDTVNKMSVAVERLQQRLSAQQEASSAKVDQVSSQVQSLNDSIDEVKARLNAMEKALQSVQGQQQSINATLQNMAPNAGGSTSVPNATPAPDSNQQTPSETVYADNRRSAKDNTFPAHQGPAGRTPVASPASDAPPISDLYKAALSDYMAAKYSLAATEFGDVVRSYPDEPLSGNAYYYLAEIDYRNGKFGSAIKNYDHVLDQFPSSSKVPVSHLHKGMALLGIKDRDGGIAEMRTLIQRFPNSPEAAQARAKLNGMGVSPGTRRPS